MRKINFKGCVISFFSAGCLTFIAILILIIIIVGNITKGKSPLSSLSNDSEYSSDNNTSNSIQNSHLQPNDKKIAFKVAFISDTENDWLNMQDALVHANNEPVAFIAHLGDVSEFGVREDLSNAKGYFEVSEAVVYPIPGDRDRYGSNNGPEAFESVFTNRYRLVEENGISFLFVDNSDEFNGIDAKQWVFIRENLPEADFVLLHNPIEFDNAFLVGHKGMGQYDEDVELQRLELLSLIRESTVKAVFAGDQHRFVEIADSEKDDLNHYVVGSLRSDRNVQLPNFAVLTIYEDGDYYVEKVVL